MNIKENLKDFYNKESNKYYQTRNKYRSDGDIVLNEIKKNYKKKISILEFGCGGGRLIKFLNKELKNIEINYIGVDISENLLDLAKKDNPKNKFVCDDISSYIKKTTQESFDFIIGVASFQHIPTYKERLYLMKNFYRSLKYDGKLIMTNWSISKWFLKKHTMVIVSSFLKSIYSLGLHKRRNLEIPWKNNNTIKKRFYHMFGIKELYNLGTLSGFKITKLSYINKIGKETSKRKESNNSIFVGKKSILK